MIYKSFINLTLFDRYNKIQLSHLKYFQCLHNDVKMVLKI